MYHSIYLCIYNYALKNFICLSINISITVLCKTEYVMYLGTSSLMEAAKNGNTDIVKLLLEHEADVNAKNNYG